MDANDLLMGSGVKSAVFPDQQFGTTVGGYIIRPPEVRQQTDFDTGKPKFFDNGDPMRQIVVHVQTDQRDPANPHDDGVRAFYIKGQMQQTAREAVRASGARGLEVGGFLAFRYERDEPNSRGRGKPKKVYTARYTPPTAQAANDALMGSPAQPAPTAYAQPASAQPIYQPPAMPAVTQTTPPLDVPPGVDPAAFAALTPEVQAQVRAAAAQLQK